MNYKCSTFVFRFFRIVRGITQTTNNGFSSTSAIMVFCRHKKIGFIVPICFEKQFIPSSLDAGIKVLTIYLLRDTTYIKRVINLAKLQFFHIEKNLEGRSGKIMMQYLLKIGSSIFHQYFLPTTTPRCTKFYRLLLFTMVYPFHGFSLSSK